MSKQTDAAPQRPSPKKGGSTRLSERLTGFVANIFRPFAFLGTWVPDWLKYHYFENVFPFLRSVVALVFSPFTIAVRAAYFIVYVLGPWWGRPQFRYLLRGLPALLVGVSCTWIVINGKLEGGATNRGQKYLKAAQIAAENLEWSKAKIFYQRAIEMGFVSPETQFELAKVAEAAGDLPVKVAVMDALAPLDRPVYASAHYWQALKYLSEQPVNNDSAQRAEQHLLFVLQLEPENQMAHAILGDLYFQKGILGASVEHLGKSPKHLPAYSLKLARALLMLGEKEKGRIAAIQAAENSVKLISTTPRDVEVRLVLAESLVLLDRFQDAQTYLLEGLQFSPDNQSLRTAMARMYVAWIEWVREQPWPNEQIRTTMLELVAAGLQYDANEPVLFRRMMEIVEGSDQTAATARQMMLENIATGKLVGLSHLVLGTVLDIENNATATQHLSEAFRLMPNGPVVANNLAWHLAVKESPDPDQAEKIILSVVEKFPDVPAFRDTLAHVLYKQERWNEALREFQRTLPEFSKNALTHRSMAVCYSKIGESELASVHEKLAAELEETQIPQMMNK